MSLVYLRIIAFLVTTYIMLTIGTTITTIYDVLLKNNLDVSEVVPIVQGLTTGFIIAYDCIFICLIRRNSSRRDLRCWDFIPHRIAMGIIISVFSLSCIMHIILFSLSLDYTSNKSTELLPAIYVFSIISPLCDFSTYVIIYDSMANGYFSPQEESTPLV